MKVLAVLTMFPNLLILFVSFYSHLFAIPLIKDMLAKLSPLAQQRYQENVVITISGYTAEFCDMLFNWWFIIIPLLALFLNLVFYQLKKTSEIAAFASVLLLITLASTVSFLSMSVNSLAVFMLVANFIK
ncbi:MAG TPA: hypothetical protein DCG57_20795 [Candidatus Riflebacteria bacterium]|jgi:hypothetical protein|nr:MAG: hypothetical protein CVV41_10345 [Candidatus Riflebacteria bacterium HGW-Riflebacteria-1]HAE41046.1 hypothetical protein [Candidatus Riflebacteria bacterium]